MLYCVLKNVMICSFVTEKEMVLVSMLPAGEFALLKNFIVVQVVEELLQYKKKPQLSFTYCRSNKYLIISANLTLRAVNKPF